MTEKFVISAETAETIRRKKARYCRFADSLEWDRFDTIMLPDFTFEGLDFDGAIVVENGVRLRWESRADWIAHFSASLKHVESMHLVDAGDLEQVAEDEVRAVFGLIYHAGPRGTTDGLHVTGGGHYYETWKKVDGDWFIASSSMKRLFHKIRSG
ncbi:hypothetical protein LY78DRAFT_658497 [Colletotrichum sublineola]|uniref:SnoaL-like domain-containing protein n=1 Tax=Colletotrichum sublineola TaxID=1173701 RepID=A0A066X874_COLSU|nr:hypothetical protein LY78DRAFT_658497 [Colletotrichum sublineola]KDN62180.1 hypothetical protein CSUB01_00885 [Colletotrichum sublineola]